MAVPTIASITPSEGLTRGRTYVLIQGTNFATQSVGQGDTVKVKVFFGGKEATAVQVQSSTRLVCLTPASNPGEVNVQVLNVGPPEESVTSSSGYTYKRPNIAGNQRTHFQEVIEAVILLFKREVIDNVVRFTHSEYDLVPADGKTVGAGAKLPVIAITGPSFGEENAWTVTASESEITYEDETPVSFRTFRAPKRVNLVFGMTVGARVDAELISLIHHCTQTLSITPKLVVTISGGTAEYDMDWAQKFELSDRASDSDLHEASCQFVIQGVIFEDGDTLEQGPVLDDPTANISYGRVS